MLVSSYAQNYFLEDYTELDAFITASVSVSISGTGALSVQKPLSGAISSVISASGTAVLDHELDSSLHVNVSSTGDVLVQKNLSASVQATTTTTGQYFVDNPLVSSIELQVAASGTATVLRPLESSVSLSVDANTALFVQKNLSASVQATATTASLVNVDKNLESAVSTTVEVVASLDVTKDLAASISTSTSVEGTVSVLKELAAEPLLFIESYGFAESLRPVSAALIFQSNTNAVIDLDKPLSSSISQSVSTSGEVQILTIISGSLICTTTSTGNLAVEKFLIGDLSADIDTNASVIVNRPLSASVLVNTAAQVIDSFTYISGTTGLVVSAFPLLDVNGNTEGAPGGEPAEGFTPSTSLLLGRQSESAAPQTYIITADFGSEEEPGVMTEMIGYTMSEQLPPDIIEFSLEGPSLVINVKTPTLILPYFVKFRTQENELRTIRNTFRTGLKTPVDYYLLDKRNTPVELIIAATARSYGIGGTTLETRTASYKLVIIGDYSASRDGLLNALKLRGVGVTK